MREGYIPRDQRRTILLLGDDIQLSSGVANMSREFVLGTCHIFNWVQLGAAVNNRKVGTLVNLSEAVKNKTGVEDPSVYVYPISGFGNESLVRNTMVRHTPAAILHFTDPRYWLWLYQMEAEIRDNIPIIYYHVWDNNPAPKYNRDYYRSCDGILTISKLTNSVVREVLGEENVEDIEFGELNES